jgi:3-oxoacyl-[acyl-carrier-protein] synthase-3
MATTIDSIAVSGSGFLQARSARRLAVVAARAALDGAAVPPSDVELLVNCGLYRDRNLGEPALAALIQEDVGINPEDPYEGGHGTFSFDVANGACGVLTALELADGFLRSGTIRRALIVTSDANPGLGKARDFPFTAAGGALLCGWEEGPAGLAGFRWERSRDDGDLSHATVGFEKGRNVLRIETQPGFADRAGNCAAKAAAAVLADGQVAVDDLDLVVASPLTDEFRESLVEYLGVADEAVVRVPGSEGIHTAALVAALQAAAEQGRLGDGHRVLLVSAGAGIVAGAALWLP